jgi:hypothetical protein
MNRGRRGALCEIHPVGVTTAFILGRSERPLASAFVFTAGAASVCVVFAVVLLVSGAFDGGGDAGDWVDVELGVLFAAFGILAVFPKEDPDKDAARRARAERVATAKLPALVGAGLAVQVVNFDALAVFWRRAEGDLGGGCLRGRGGARDALHAGRDARLLPRAGRGSSAQ